MKDKSDLAKRLKGYSLLIIELFINVETKGEVGRTIGKQLLRSGTSPGAQYCEAIRSRSKAEFISKMSSCLQEIEETKYWLELLVESKTMKPEEISSLLDETQQLIAIFISSVNTAKQRSVNK